jgi:membrane protein implicated in regulation of membrane protease activity
MDLTTVILITFVAFVALAYVLLAPVYRFLKREEKVSAQWTQETLEKERRKAAQTNGSHRVTPSAPDDDDQSDAPTVR